MVTILNNINKTFKEFDYSKDEAQSLCEDAEGNRDKIMGYCCRIGLIWLRKKEIAWKRNLDELVPDALAYFCEYGHKYITRKLYTHYPRVKGKNKGADSYVNLQCYCQNLQLRIAQILSKYCQDNPNSKLCQHRTEICKSELKDGDIDKANQLEDIIANKLWYEEDYESPRVEYIFR